MSSNTPHERQIRGLRRRLRAERLGFLVTLTAILLWHFGRLGGGGACLIAVDGDPVAVVATRADAVRLLDEAKRGSGLPGEVAFSQHVTLHRVKAAGHRVLPDAEALEALSSRLEPVVQASAILANGELVVGLPTRREAVETLSSLLKHFSPPLPGVQAAFKERVQIEPRPVNADQFAPSAAAAVERISEAAAPKGKHEVRPGETAWKIALDYHVPLSRLAATNPGADLNRLRAGDELKIPGELPPITVIARRLVEESVASGGSQTVRISYENAAEIGREVIARKRPQPRRDMFPSRQDSDREGEP